jgi:hypothetical protein
MKKILAGLLAIIPLFTFAQYEDIAPGWKKYKDRAPIIAKMDELVDRLSFEFECDKEQISYIVLEKYKFYKMNKNDLNFPKKLAVKVCGTTYTYLIECPPNSYGKPNGWIKGKWIVDPIAKEE